MKSITEASVANLCVAALGLADRDDADLPLATLKRLLTLALADVTSVPLADADVPVAMLRYLEAFRALPTTGPAYDGPIAWSVRGGFNLRRDTPRLLPCVKDFEHLWELDNEATKDAFVLFKPRLLLETFGVNGGTSDHLTKTFGALREKLGLHHPDTLPLCCHSASLIAQLLVGCRRFLGERPPLDGVWAQTGTFAPGAYPVLLGNFTERTGLDGRIQIDGRDDDLYSHIGSFPLAVWEYGS